MLSDGSRVRRVREMQFNEVLLSAVDDILNRVLGEESARLVDMYLKTVLFMGRKEIADKPEVFEAGLRKLLGEGAYDIMTNIVNTLYYKLGVKYTQQDSFKNHINRARRYYLRKR